MSDIPWGNRTVRGVVPLAVLLCALGLLTAGWAGGSDGEERPQQPASTPKASAAPKFTTETAGGRVVWLEDALERRYGVTTDPAVAETTPVLETPDGKLLPFVPDVRGHAFAVDARLRNIDLELLVRRYTGVPLIQVIRVMQRKPDGLYELDYWCDICAISMATLKACECCQGETRLRERPVAE